VVGDRASPSSLGDGDDVTTRGGSAARGSDLRARAHADADALRRARRSLSAQRTAYVDALRESRRSSDEKRDAVDLDHPQLLLGFWLTTDSNCVDIGANRGRVLKMIDARARRGQHHAFEPLPRRANGLREGFPAVTVHEIAFTDAPGTAEFTVVDVDRYDGYSGLTRSLRPLPADWPTHTTTMRTARLDGGGPYRDADAMIAGAKDRTGWLWNWVCL
jgi:hypothetical protein